MFFFLIIVGVLLFRFVGVEFVCVVLIGILIVVGVFGEVEMFGVVRVVVLVVVI